MNPTFPSDSTDDIAELMFEVTRNYSVRKHAH
jgi:hypothetical protein